MSASEGTIVFLGPTLPQSVARDLLDAKYLPPAQRGDVKRLLDGGVRRIALIDGLFHIVPSVWQRELVAAIDAGIEVFGAASMGALRAVEVERYGMVGHGVIFEWYRSDLIEGDDEVALLHGDADSGWRALSEPLVNLRATIATLRARRLLSAAEATTLLSEAQQAYYYRRSLQALTTGPLANTWTAQRREEIAGALRAHYVDQKRLDAESLLRYCAATPIAAAPIRGRRDLATSVRGVQRDAPQSTTTTTTSTSSRKVHQRGTHRALAPEATLARITPHLSRWGITRVADVTQLDSLGIPTCCSVRPTALTLQISNGKGLRLVDAKVSALMEAVELAHLESAPQATLAWATCAQMAQRGEAFSWDVPDFMRGKREPEGPIEWVRGTELFSGAPVWLPACAAWQRPAQFLLVTSNGLASGNTLVEATLHGLYEVLERHCLSWLDQAGQVDLTHAQVLDPAEALDADIRELHARIEGSDVQLVLLRVDTPLRLHTFMAVLLDRQALGAGSMVNVGSGAHLSPTVAATRAITEAAQSRLAFIHGARDDLRMEQYRRAPTHERVLEFFSDLEPDTDWDDLDEQASEDLDEDLARVLGTMKANGLPRAFRIDMSVADVPYHVVKLIVPRTRRFDVFRTG
jgi:ribosomal protein S12 methylthiotransferase accessory factor